MPGILLQSVSITPDEVLLGCKPQPFSPSLPQLQLTDKCEQLVVHAFIPDIDPEQISCT